MTRSTKRGQASASPPPAASTSAVPPPATRRSTRASSANPPEASDSSAGGTGTKSRGSTPARELRRGRSRGPSVPPADLEAVAEVPGGLRSRRGSVTGSEGKGKEKAEDEAGGDEMPQDGVEQPLDSLIEGEVEEEVAVKSGPVDEAVSADSSADAALQATQAAADADPTPADAVDLGATAESSWQDSVAAGGVSGESERMEEGSTGGAASPAAKASPQPLSRLVVDARTASSPPAVADAAVHSRAPLAITFPSKPTSPPWIDSPNESSAARDEPAQAESGCRDVIVEDSAEVVGKGVVVIGAALKVDGAASKTEKNETREGGEGAVGRVETAGDAEPSCTLPAAKGGAVEAGAESGISSASADASVVNEASAVATAPPADSARTAPSAQFPTPVTALARAAATATASPSSPSSPAASPAVAENGTKTPTTQSKRSPPIPAGGIAMPPSLQAMTPKDVRKRFNTHKIACVQTLNVELIKVANELVKEKPLKQVEYMPLMQRLQSNLAYLTAMSQINQKQDGTRSSPPPPILEAPSTPILGPRLAASYATLKGYFIAAEKYEIQYKRGLTIVPTAASDNTGIHSIASVGERSPMSSRIGITSTPTLASSEVNGAGGKRTREEEVTGGREGATAGPGDWMDGPDAKKGKLDLPTVPEEEVVPANPPPSNALAPPANLVVNQPPAAIGFPGTPSDNAARFNAPPPDTAYAVSPAHNQVFPPPSGPLATASIPQARRSATPSQSFATPQQPPSRPTSAQPGQMYGSAIPAHLQQQQAQQVQQSPRQNQYGAPPQQDQQQSHHLMRSQQAQAPDRPPSAAANPARPVSASQNQQFVPQPPPNVAHQQQFQPPPSRTPVQQPQQVPPRSAVAGTSGVGGDDRPIAEQYSSVQAIISAPTFRQLPPALQQQMQTQAQNLLYQMQAQAVAAARGGGVNQGQQQQCMMTPAPPGPAAVASSPRNRVPSYSQSPHVAHAQVRQASVGVAEPQYAGSYAGSLAGSPPVMQQIPQQQQVRPTSATSTGDNSSAAFFREQLAAQQQALRSSTPAQYAPSPQQQHMSVAPSPHLQPNRPPSTPANHAAFGAHQRVASGPYQQQANPYTQQVASPVQYVAASPAQQHAPSPAGYPVPQPQQPYQQAGTPAPRLFSTGSVAAAPSPRAPSRGPGTPGPGPQQRVPQQYQYVPKPSQQQYSQQSFAHPPQQQQQFPSQQAPAGSFASSAVPSAALSMPPPPAPTPAAQRPQLPLQPLTSASTATSSIPVSAASGSSPFLTGTSPSTTLAGNVASTNAFATGSASWNSVNLGTPSVGVGLPGSDPWGNPLDSLASSSTANAGNPSTDISMAADDDWESFLNL